MGRGNERPQKKRRGRAAARGGAGGGAFRPPRGAQGRSPEHDTHKLRLQSFYARAFAVRQPIENARFSAIPIEAMAYRTLRPKSASRVTRACDL